MTMALESRFRPDCRSGECGNALGPGLRTAQKLLIIQTLDSVFESMMARWLPSGEGKPQAWVDWGRCQIGCASPLSETRTKIAPPGAIVETNML